MQCALVRVVLLVLVDVVLSISCLKFLNGKLHRDASVKFTIISPARNAKHLPSFMSGRPRTFVKMVCKDPKNQYAYKHVSWRNVNFAFSELYRDNHFWKLCDSLYNIYVAEKKLSSYLTAKRSLSI